MAMSLFFVYYFFLFLNSVIHIFLLFCVVADSGAVIDLIALDFDSFPIFRLFIGFNFHYLVMY